MKAMTTSPGTPYLRRSIQQSKGFTLIELMIVVAVVTILAMIAYPSYQNAIVKGHRAEGRTALLNLMQQEERYLTQNGTYMAFTTVTSSVPFQGTSGDNASNAAWTLAARACSGLSINECVQVYATPTAGKPDPVISELNITSTGVKSCTATDTTVCWP